MVDPNKMPTSEELRALQEVTIKLPQWCINQLQNMKDFVNNATAHGRHPSAILTLDEFLSVFVQSQVTLEGQKLNSLYRF